VNYFEANPVCLNGRPPRGVPASRLASHTRGKVGIEAGIVKPGLPRCAYSVPRVLTLYGVVDFEDLRLAG
jgi:hypothetical protein